MRKGWNEYNDVARKITCEKRRDFGYEGQKSTGTLKLSGLLSSYWKEIQQ